VTNIFIGGINITFMKQSSKIMRKVMKKRKLFAAVLICTTVSMNVQAIAATHDVNVSEVINKTYDGYVTQGNGGAITNTISSIVKDSNFKNNQALSNGAGGAIDLNTTPDTLTQVINSHFDNNYSDYEGGAIAQRRNSGSLQITGGSYTNNTAKYEGGALFLGSNADVTSAVENVLFEGNKTLSTTWNDKYSTNDDGGGGAIFVGSKAKVNISNSNFNNNSSNTVGGAIAVRNDSKNNGSNSLTITDSNFTNNEALIDGGAIASFIDFSIKNSTLTGNTAGRNGGAISLDLSHAAMTDETTFENITLSNNNANNMGGAIFNKSNGTVNVQTSVISSNTAKWGGGIAHASSGTLNVTNTAFESNKATVQGGAIVSLRHNTNKDSIVLNVENAQFKGNEAGAEGGAIWSGSKTNITGSTFDGNRTTGTTLSETPNFNTDDEGGGAVFVGSNSVTSITNSTFTNNQSGTVGGAIATRSNAKNDGTTSLDITSSNFDGNKANVNGGAIAAYIDSTITDTSFTNNSAGSKGGAVWTNQNLTLNAIDKNVVMSGNSAADGGDIFMNKEGANLNLNAAEGKSITVASGISGNENGYNMLVNANGGTGSLIVDSAIQNATIAVNAGTFQLGQNAALVDSHLTMSTGSTFNSINGRIDTPEMIAKGDSSVTFADGTNIAADVNIGNGTADNFTGVDMQGKVTLTDINPIANTTANNVSINLAEALGIDPNKMAISEALQNNTAVKVLTPIRYLQGGVSENGMLTMAPTGSGYKDFNPGVMSSPIAAQLGGYLTQLNSYDQAFRNMDMYMLMTKKQREAMKLRNKYAAADGNLIFDPTGSAYDNKAVWVRPYATFENVPLKGGPRVSNVAYGSFFGAESELYDLGHGWDGMWGVYAGYNGSHQAYDGIGIYQNGGTLGLVGMAYKGNFFTGLTINAGANAGEANTFYGTDNFSMLMAGVASKTGYNIELADGKFIIQPNFLMSYSFVNTFDYTNAAGVRMSSNPLNAIQLEPGIKFIGNLKNGWQPYAGVSVVWNIMDKTEFHANNVALPELSVKPFVRYGIGVRKTWGEVCTGFLQTYFTSGGRNGVGLQAGFRFTLGKGGLGSLKSSNNMPELPKTQINLSSAR